MKNFNRCVRHIVLAGILIFLCNCSRSGDIVHEQRSFSALISKNQHLTLNISSIDLVIADDADNRCDFEYIITPQSALISWLKNVIRINGQNDAALNITIKAASLQKNATQHNISHYHGHYNVILKITQMQKGSLHNKQMEWTLDVQNHRDALNNLSKADLKDILEMQLQELIRLLEEELMNKSKIYFADFVTKE